MSECQSFLSVITPTYNRAYCLGNVYQSLLQQTNFNFEWIVVDDGSTDNTKELINQWEQNANPFSLIHLTKENGGKHTAVNLAVQHAKGDFCYIIDSDDKMTPDAVEKIYSWIPQIKDNPKFAGVSGTRRYENGQTVGNYPAGEQFVDCTNLERQKNHLLGDKAEIYRTDILKKYPFPVFAGERFLPEGVVWDKIASDGYLLRWFHDATCICEYREDGLTKNGTQLGLASFNGFTLAKKMAFHLHSFPYNYAALLAYEDVARQKGLSTGEIKKQMDLNSWQYFVSRCLALPRTILRKIKKNG